MWWLLGILVAYAIYVMIIKPMNYWKERNLVHRKPWPILGNMAPTIFRKRNFKEHVIDLYNEFPNLRYNGIYFFLNPQILIRDLDLIKQITVKDFDYFMNRTSSMDQDSNDLLAKSLISLSGQKWRNMRSTLSPSFTSSKMRLLFTLISDCAEQFAKYYENQKDMAVEVNMKDACTRFTNDVIASAAFGITVDSLNNRDNEFFLMGKDITSFGGLRGIKFVLFANAPKLMKFLKISMFPKEFSTFFSKIIKETIDIRETKGLIRPDMIHLLLETRRGKISNDEQLEAFDTSFAAIEDLQKDNSSQKAPLSDEDIIAQAMLFFFAGFETSSTLMCFMSHELATNPDVQEKLQAEVDETIEKCDGKITYEALLNMKYLDMVISESLRKWSPGIALDRVCIKDYILKPQFPDEKPIIIEKGVTIFIPIAGIHHDPKYFPNPDKFDPERFNDENKSKILPFSYMPFGAGPRSCIASRFALLKVKILFFHLLSKFDIVPVEKTAIPLVLSRKSIIMAPENGFWIGLEQRENCLKL